MLPPKLKAIICTTSEAPENLSTVFQRFVRNHGGKELNVVRIDMKNRFGFQGDDRGTLDVLIGVIPGEIRIPHTIVKRYKARD